MNPTDFVGDVLGFDAVAGVAVVLHYLPGTAAALDVYLEVDDIPSLVIPNLKSYFRPSTICGSMKVESQAVRSLSQS